MSGWAECPACTAIVANPVAHAEWHAAQQPVGVDPGVVLDEGRYWPDGVQVPVMAAPTPEEVESQTRTRRRVRETLTLLRQAIPDLQAIPPAMDAYLALEEPTPEDDLAHVADLTRAAALLANVLGEQLDGALIPLVRLLGRQQEDPDALDR